MVRSRRKLSDAERERRRRRDRERLAEAMRELLSSDGWKAWLRARATLHDYSFHNTCLIAQEARRRGFHATHVAGFKAWLKLGRCVRKGERGLTILAPVKVKERDDAGNETGELRIFFRRVHVFDTLSRDRRWVVRERGEAVGGARRKRRLECRGGAREEPGGRRARAAALYDRAAVRWLGRLLLEQPDLGLDDAGVTLAALDQLAQWPATAKVLARMVDH